MTYNVTRRDFLKPSSRSSILTAALAAFATWYLTGNVVSTALVTVGVFLFFALAAFVLGRFIKKYLQNTGIKSGCILPRDSFRIDDNVVEILTSSNNSRQFEFATSETADICGQLNYEAFKTSAWHTTVEDKIRRNRSHINKNCKSILLIKDSTGNYVGFTHILLVNNKSWKRYKQGKLADNEFSAERICNEASFLNKNKPYGLIVFSVAVAKRVHGFTNPESYKSDVGRLLERAIIYHVEAYLKSTFLTTEEVPVLFQNESPDFHKDFDMPDEIEISKDGATIVTFAVCNNWYQKLLELKMASPLGIY